jgi:hypothetical protein
MNAPNEFQTIPGIQLLVEELIQILQQPTSNAAAGIIDACSSIDGFISHHPTFFTQEGSKDVFRNYILSEASKKLSESSSSVNTPSQQPYVQQMVGNNMGTVGGQQQPFASHTFGMYSSPYTSNNIGGSYPPFPTGMYGGPSSHPQNHQLTNQQYGHQGSTNIPYGASTMSPAGAYNLQVHGHHNVPHGNNWQQPPMAANVMHPQNSAAVANHPQGEMQPPQPVPPSNFVARQHHVPNAFGNPPTMMPTLATQNVQQQNVVRGVNAMSPPDAIVIPTFNAGLQPNVPNQQQQFGNNQFANIQQTDMNQNAATVIAGNTQRFQIPAPDLHHVQPSIVADSVSFKKNKNLLIYVLSRYPTWRVDPDTALGRQMTDCQSGLRSCFL